MGNLPGPLNFFQVAGIWPSLDFRYDPHLKPAAIALAAFCLAIAAITAAVAARLGERDGVPLAGYVFGGALGALAIAYVGSPWIDAKVTASLSPALLAAALIGIAMLGQRSGFRLKAAALGVVVAGAVAWSAFLAYQGVWFAPRSHFTELEKIGERFAGEGPALSTEVSIYGPRHFLRKLDAEGASDRRRRPIDLVGGGEPNRGTTSTSMKSSLPNSTTTRCWWCAARRLRAARRPISSSPTRQSTTMSGSGSPGTLVEHLPLGTSLDAGDVPECSDVQRLAQEAGKGASWRRPGWEPLSPSGSQRTRFPPAGALPTPTPSSRTARGASARRSQCPGANTSCGWEGAVFGEVKLGIDGEEVASERARIDNVGGYEPLGPVRLTAGKHRLEVDYEGASLWPGSAAQPWEIGSLVLEEPEQGDLGLITVSPADYRRLCGSVGTGRRR